MNFINIPKKKDLFLKKVKENTVCKLFIKEKGYHLEYPFLFI